jgi:hypothetical protein
MTVWPRFKMYGVPGNFRRVVYDLALGRVHAGDDVARFEQEICRLSSSRHAVAMPQARVGIHLALKSLIRRSGRRKVILSPYTIYDVVNMVISAGGIPVFVDVDANNGNIDPSVWLIVWPFRDLSSPSRLSGSIAGWRFLARKEPPNCYRPSATRFCAQRYLRPLNGG